MPRTRTATDTAAWWLAQAERYEREAAKNIGPTVNAFWQKKAAEARAAAATYPIT